MKIVCDSCATKYSISDDKVRGKVFKIRCKKCSHIIVVRGNHDGAAAAAPAGQPAPAASEGGWHLVVDGDQVGPLSDADVRGRLSRGEINADSFIWKDGFADWVKLSTVAEFADDLPAPGLESHDGAAEAHDHDAGAEGNGVDAGAMVSAVASPTNSGGLFGSISVAPEEPASDPGLGSFRAPASSTADLGGGGDLFAAQAARPAVEENRWSNSGGVAASAAANHDGGRVESLTAQRHENSVLFSLSNLQSLASPGGAASKPAANTSATPSPGSEGSGLIDIRAMAATTLGSSPDTRGGFGGGSSAGDDLPSFGAFSPAAPVLLSLPTPSGPPKWIYGAIGLMVALVGVIVWMAMKILAPPAVVEAPPAPAPASAPAAAPRPAETVAAAPAAAPAPTTPAIPDEKLPPRDPAAGGKPAETAPAAAAAAAGKGAKKGSGKGGRKGGAVTAEALLGAGGGSRPAAAAVPPPTPAEPVGAKPTKGSLDDLLESAINKRPSAAAPKPREEDRKPAAEPASAGPLSKNAVVAGMNGIKGKISDCYNQYKVPGMVMVNIVIGKNGKVSSATSTGKFAGTPTGTCVEKAVKSASFPPSDGLSTPYPIVLK